MLALLRAPRSFSAAQNPGDADDPAARNLLNQGIVVSRV